MTFMCTCATAGSCAQAAAVGDCHAMRASPTRNLSKDSHADNSYMSLLYVTHAQQHPWRYDRYARGHVIIVIESREKVMALTVWESQGTGILIQCDSDCHAVTISSRAQIFTYSKVMHAI